MKKEILKNVIIGILLLIIIALISVYLLNPKYSTESTNLLQSELQAQMRLSEYIGKLRSDTFDQYTVEQLLVGSYNLEDIQNSIIVSSDGEDIKSFVYTTKDDIKTVDDIKYYRVDVNKFMSVLNSQLINDANLVWYVSDTGVLKISFSRTPSWWTSEFEVFHLN